MSKPPRATWRGTPLHELWLEGPDGNAIEIYARLTDEELAGTPADLEPTALTLSPHFQDTTSEMADGRCAMAKRKKAAGAEWVGGIASMPSYVTSEGPPFRPELLLWMNADGAIVGQEMGRPGELLTIASEHLRATIAHPMFGGPASPARVRVASADLAAELRAGHPALDVVCAPTPEVDEALASLREHMESRPDEEESFLAGGNSAAAMGAMFSAAAALYRAKPWKVVPGDGCLFSVSADALSLHGAVVSVIGQLGQSLGFVVFENLDAFLRYAEAAHAMSRGEEPSIPAHFSLSFERGAEVSPPMRKEIETYRWEVAAAAAYPWLAAVDSDMVPRPPTADELTLAEAICRALPVVLRDEKKLLEAWRADVPYEKALTVSTHAGDLAVVVRAPHEDELVDELVDPEDDDALRAADDALARRFAESPEGRTLAEVRDAGMIVVDLAVAQFGKSVATLRASELRELLFEIIPAKVMAEPAEAPAIVAGVRAFYTFLKRERVAPHADECLRVLDRDAASKLRVALSDPTKFGMGKSLLSAGRDAGFDMETREGVEAWMRELQDTALPPSPATRPPEKKPAKKDQRKAARKARKKNR